MFDWTAIVVALILALPSTVGAIFAGINYLRLRTPSGDRIGAVAERTEHLSSAAVLHTTELVRRSNGEGGDCAV